MLTFCYIMSACKDTSKQINTRLKRLTEEMLVGFSHPVVLHRFYLSQLHIFRPTSLIKKKRVTTLRDIEGRGRGIWWLQGHYRVRRKAEQGA